MSSTSTRPRRLTRLAAGLTVAAAATATTLLGASPAYAQPSTIGAVVVNGGLTINGTNGNEGVTVNVDNGDVTVTNTTQTSMRAALGCTLVTPKIVRCVGVNRLITFNGFGGNDLVRNNTSVPSILVGGAGSDRLFGGSADDRIDGDSEFDSAFGNGGFDTCVQIENASSCEVNA